MNGELRHYSPSAVAMWMDEPALYILWKRFRVRGDMGVKAWLGDAAHQGTALGLIHEAPIEDCIRQGRLVLTQRAEGESNDEIDGAMESLEPMIRNALDALKPLGKPLAAELKVQCPIPGTNAVLHGRTDFTYSAECVDLKTSVRVMKEANTDQLRALAFYRAATGKEQRLLYVTDRVLPEKPRKDQAPLSGWIAPPKEHLDMAWNGLCRAVAALERADAMSDAELIALFPPRDMSGFRWDEPTRTKAAEIWGI